VLALLAASPSLALAVTTTSLHLARHHRSQVP
jgi:hypothetical protein